MEVQLHPVGVSEEIPADLGTERSVPGRGGENAGVGIPQRWLRRSGLVAGCGS